jgi:dephospho-CoA kinase
MLQIGLTGGIGVGKTTVSKILNVLEIPVFNADDEAKKIMRTDEMVQKNIIAAFGKESYQNNKLNTQYIANIVFNNSYQLEILNSIVHPATINYYNNWVLQQTAAYVVKEAALMFEAGSTTNINFIIGVFAPKNVRYKRVMQRDNITKEQVDARMQHQIDDEIKLKLCDAVIINDEQHLLINQVIKIHNQIMGFVK